MMLLAMLIMVSYGLAMPVFQDDPTRRQQQDRTQQRNQRRQQNRNQATQNGNQNGNDQQQRNRRLHIKRVAVPAQSEHHRAAHPGQR